MTPSRYRLSFPQPHNHLVEVEARFNLSSLTGQDVDLSMAAWTPGSYLIREYGRHIQELAVSDESGRPLPVTKTEKATWRVRRGAARELVARYRVYGHELTVRTNHVDGSHAFVNGAPTYLWIKGLADQPAEVTVEPPPGWIVATALDGQAGRYRAANLDELVDSPIHAGPEAVRDFTAAGRPAQLAVWGRPDAGGLFPDPVAQLIGDVSRIVEGHANLFGGLPYDRYVFQLMLAPGAYGGLEHARSCALLSNPFVFASRKAYEELLELVSHEFFHLWNVKRIHPSALGPFDYEREAYTSALWVMEGLTSYYDRHMLRRTGLVTAKRYLEKLAEEWGKLQAIPGRRRQSIEESSFDAWIKLYRPDENSVNSTVSYYLKGSLVALCMDLEIRRRTEGRKSLDDGLLHLWRRFGERGVGFEDGAVQGELERAVELDLGAYFDACVRGRQDPDLGAILASVGLTLKTTWTRDTNGDASDESAPAWLGLTTRQDGTRLLATGALEGGPVERDGVYAGDEIVALDGYRVDDRSLDKRILARKPGDTVRLTVFRRDELREVPVRLGERPRDKFEIVPVEKPGADEKALYRAWLGEAHPKE